MHHAQTCILLEGNGRAAKAEMNKLYAEMGKMQASVEQMATMRDHWEKDALEARKIMKEQVSTCSLLANWPITVFLFAVEVQR